MNNKENKIKKPDYSNLSQAVDNSEEYLIPYEAACSHEFSEGCIIAEEDTDK